MQTQTTTVVTLTPDEGKMLFDGQTYSDKVYVREDLASNWQEVPMAQYEQWLAEEEEKRLQEEALRQQEELERQQAESYQPEYTEFDEVKE